LADLFLGSNQYGGSPETLQRYFDAFAVAASRERGRDPASTDAPIA
jgi:hypothetical protein